MRIGVIVPSEEVLGEVERRRRERTARPASGRRRRGARSPFSPITPQKSQTRFQNAAAILDRPGMQGVVVAEVAARSDGSLRRRTG